jgi:tetratricopeptide (TPR) repeat protein
VSQAPYGQALHALAGVLVAEDKFTEAEILLRGALAKQEDALGADHPSVGPTLTNLAIALVQEQRLGDAEEVVTRALALTEAAHGEAHEETARILTILAQVQAALGNDEAPATARRALQALVATNGPDHPLVEGVRPILEDIAASGESDAILEAAADALDAREVARAIAMLGPLVERARRDGLVPLEASASGMLAQALFLAGRRREALELAHRALACAEDAGQTDAAAHFRELTEAMDGGDRGDAGIGVPEALHARIQECIQLAQQGDVASAVQDLEACADEAARSRETGNEATVRIVLGQILQAVGDANTAARHLRRALEIAEAMGDRDAGDHVRRMLGAANGTMA